MSVLRSCPFCGSGKNDVVTDELGEKSPALAMINGAGAAVACLVCKATGPNAKTPEQAAEKWNTRLPE